MPAWVLEVEVFSPPLACLGLLLMQPGEGIAPLAKSYTYIRVYSAPVVLMTYAAVGWFIGRQNTRWPMVIVIITNTANILLDGTWAVARHFRPLYRRLRGL